MATRKRAQAAKRGGRAQRSEVGTSSASRAGTGRDEFARELREN